MDQFISWYIGKVHVAARQDATVSLAFLRVVNMIVPATSLLHPRMALRVLRGNLDSGAASRPSLGPASLYQSRDSAGVADSPTVVLASNVR